MKGADVASYEGHDLIPLFNPRTQSWDDHFEMDGAVIAGKTAIGRVTVRILQLNSEEQIEIRERLIHLGMW